MTRKRFAILGATLASLFALVLLAGCSSSEPTADAETADDATTETTVIHMGSSGLYTSMVDIIADMMPDEYDVELVTVDSNTGCAEGAAYGDIDCWIYNHEPWINQYNESNGTDFVVVNHLYYGRSALYSDRYENLEDLPDGCTIAICNDSVNMENNLLFLEDLGLITLGEKSSDDAFLTTLDIIDNPKNIQFVEVEISYAVSALSDCDAAVVSATSILQAGKDPEKFLAENMSKVDYPIGLTLSADKQDEPWVQAMLDVMSSDEFKERFNEVYQGSLVLYDNE